jgi:hypothetical protein
MLHAKLITACGCSHTMVLPDFHTTIDLPILKGNPWMASANDPSEIEIVRRTFEYRGEQEQDGWVIYREVL